MTLPFFAWAGVGSHNAHLLGDMLLLRFGHNIFSKAGGRVLQLRAAAEEGEEPGRSLDALGLEVEAPRAGTPWHENVKNWRLLAAKSTQNLCTPRTPELPSEAPREAHLRELRPRRPVHELLPRCSRDFCAIVYGELLPARPGRGCLKTFFC